MEYTGSDLPRHALASAVILAVAASALAFGQTGSRSKPVVRPDSGKIALDPPTQTLPAAVDLPMAIAAETAHLTFHVSPLSGKGLLLQQTRDALKALMQANHGGRIIKLRAFVAGTGDARRVRQIVSDAFAEKKKPLPALTTIEAGELPKEGAQIVLESVSEEAGSRPANPGGLAFFPARPADDLGKALGDLTAAATKAGVNNTDMLRVTCFLDSNDQGREAASAVGRTFPVAAANGAVDIIQRLRAASGSSAACEGVARLRSAAAGPVLATGAALVTAPKLILTGAQMAFGDKEADLRLAFQRLEKTLEPLGATYRDVVFAGFYPVGRGAAEKAPALSGEFFHNPVPATTLIFEGLPSPDASMSMEVVAAVHAGQ